MTLYNENNILSKKPEKIAMKTPGSQGHGVSLIPTGSTVTAFQSHSQRKIKWFIC